ncbi:MAG: T9SS type A sorting domain-containing protein, partial [Candidatus Kapaibacterium sp.]
STYTPLSSGNHCVKITDDNGCESEVECVDFIVSIPAEPSESVRIEPNPVDETFRIVAPSAGSAPCAVRLLDMCGHEVMRQVFSSIAELREARFQVTNEPAGVYFVVVDLGTNAPLILKLVKI